MASAWGVFILPHGPNQSHSPVCLLVSTAQGGFLDRLHPPSRPKRSPCLASSLEVLSTPIEHLQPSSILSQCPRRWVSSQGISVLLQAQPVSSTLNHLPLGVLLGRHVSSHASHLPPSCLILSGCSQLRVPSLALSIPLHLPDTSICPLPALGVFVTGCPGALSHARHLPPSQPPPGVLDGRCPRGTSPSSFMCK